MYQATRVNGVQALGQRGGQPMHRRRVERAIAPDPGIQGRAREVLRNHPGRIRVRIGVDDGGRVVAADQPGGLDLAPEPRPELRVADQVWSGSA